MRNEWIRLVRMVVAWMMALAGGVCVPGTAAVELSRDSGIGTWACQRVPADEEMLLPTDETATFEWLPQSMWGPEWSNQEKEVIPPRKTLLAFVNQKDSYELKAADANLSITPVARHFGVEGGGASIVVSGSGTWQASVSDDWIRLKATSGTVGYSVAYWVGATDIVESRTGYVYVSGHTHTVTQDGRGATISPEDATFELDGGKGSISVKAPAMIGWQAQANCDWLSVGQASGAGPGTLTYTVSAYDTVNTRQGTLTVAGNTFTVFQYGRRMKISPATAEYDYLTHVIPITVDALSITEWTVEPQNSWISVVDGGNGKGGDLVTIAIAENPSWKARTGTVIIGTETFTVTQKGRTALEFSISPTNTTASVEGANGVIAVTATPDLPWSAASQASWLTLYTNTASGAGNGNVDYTASPNPTLYERTGMIVVRPGDTKVSAKKHTVTQPAAVSALSANGYEFAAAGESYEVRVSLSDIVQWSIQNTNGWLTVVGETGRVGPGTVTLQASPNETVYPNEGTVTIARKSFKVRQKARGVEVEYESKLFGADGGSDSIAVHPDGNVTWRAVPSDAWISVWNDGDQSGDGEVFYIVDPYAGPGEARTGSITIGDKVVWISQRPYDVSIDPSGSEVAGNNGAGEFGVSASIGDVWTAIATEPWITFIEGYDAGMGNGTVRFLFADNDTGTTRVGKIIVAGEVYTLQQRDREFVTISAKSEHGGRVAGAGAYDRGTMAELTAIPASGYAFSHWTGDMESTNNPLQVLADDPKSVTAVFKPLPVQLTGVSSSTNGVMLRWKKLAWARTYRIFRKRIGDPVVLKEDFSNLHVNETGSANDWQWTKCFSDSTNGVRIGSSTAAGNIQTPDVPLHGHAGRLEFSLRYYDSTAAVKLEQSTDEGETWSEVAGYSELSADAQTYDVAVPASVMVRFRWSNEKMNQRFYLDDLILYAMTAEGTPVEEEQVAELPNSGRSYIEWLDETGEVEVEYSYWVEAIGIRSEDDTKSESETGRKIKSAIYSPITYENLMEAENPNPAEYQEEKTLTFENPGPVTGYTFAGWTPTRITVDMTGPQTVTAAWTTNQYRIRYDSNGGSGSMGTTQCTYDQEVTLEMNRFSRSGWRFAGWTTEPDGTVAFADGQVVSNLTAESGGVVYLYAVWNPLVVAMPVIVPPDGTVFLEEECVVELSCATEGATIYFATNGAEPQVAEDYLYAGPFAISNSTTVKAMAELEGVRSGVVEATIMRLEMSLAEAVGAPELPFTTGGDAEWRPTVDATAAGGFAAGSGIIGNNGETWMETTVSGAGTFQFAWKVDCEWDDDGEATWDHLSVSVDGVEKGRLDGTTEWATVAFELEDVREHVVRWTFTKDDYDEEGAVYSDRSWISDVVWRHRLVTISALPGHGGVVEGAGRHVLGTTIELRAIPDSGYAFSHWTGDTESTENPLQVVVNEPKNFTAVFEPLPIAFERAESSEEGVWLAWNNLAWADSYRIYRLETEGMVWSEDFSELTLGNGVSMGAFNGWSGRSCYEIEHSLRIGSGSSAGYAQSTNATLGGRPGRLDFSMWKYDSDAAVTLKRSTDGGTTWTKVAEYSGLSGSARRYSVEVPSSWAVMFKWSNAGGKRRFYLDDVVLYAVGVENESGQEEQTPPGNLEMASAKLVAELPNTGDCEWLDDTGEGGLTCWYWVKAVGSEDEVTSEPVVGMKVKPIIISPIVYENLMGAENPNPAEYQEETSVTFENPGAVTGYTFTGWTPPQITADMTGPQTVTASWTANQYRIRYDSNGGSGSMGTTQCTYDQEVTLETNRFSRSGWRFAGWTTESDGAVAFADGQVVSNLTAESGGVVRLYAVWNPLVVAMPVIVPPDGTVFLEKECVVALSCATEGATIYFATNGAEPEVSAEYLYAGQFSISNTTTVKAMAELEGRRSEVAQATITRLEMSLAKAAGAPALPFTTGGDADWRPVVDATAAGWFVAGSGTIGDNGNTWMETTVSGTGTFQFDWKVDCEWDESGEATWDHLAISVDGVEKGRLDGTTAWTSVTLDLEGAGAHAVRWTFSKDDYDTDGVDFADRAWVTGVVWTPGEDPIPAIEDDSEVADALAGSADSRLAARITTAAQYDEYRNWVAAKNLDRQAVKESPHAWISFAFGAEELFDNEPTIQLGVFGDGDGNLSNTGNGLSLDLGVTVKDGASVAEVDAAKVAAMFKCTSDAGDWTGTSALATTVTPIGSQEGVLGFRVTVEEGMARCAFVRIVP